MKEVAKRKSELGDKINKVHDTITKHKLGEKTSQESLAKVFKPVTTKLDDVIVSNLKMPNRKLKRGKKGNTITDIDYTPEVDPYEDMDIEGLIDFGDYVPPQQEKQIVPKPPTYEESLKDVMEGRSRIYMNPDIVLPREEEPPEYDGDETHDYALHDEDTRNTILDDIGIQNYESVEKILHQPEMTHQNTKNYLNKIIKDAKLVRNQLKGYKSNITKQFNSGVISEAGKQMENKRIDNARVTLNEYIKHYKNKLTTIHGSGLRKKKEMVMRCFSTIQKN